MTVDLADESQRQMDLFVALPACTGDTPHHVQQTTPNVGRRSNSDEKPVHGLRSIAVRRGHGTAFP
jgi:hypothetical protein